MGKINLSDFNIVKIKGNLAIHAGAGMARGLYMGINLKNGKVSYWGNSINNIKISDCVH